MPTTTLTMVLTPVAFRPTNPTRPPTLDIEPPIPRHIQTLPPIRFRERCNVLASNMGHAAT
ncbi:hypothetical protein SK128_003566 [Halocaridina rubra]|uniref:Uncharacterized protein n=1 Tax=Halocaridina rubra TaxID=373956 RepID=A0AAN9ADZ3_HALRR